MIDAGFAAAELSRKLSAHCWIFQYRYSQQAYIKRETDQLTGC